MRHLADACTDHGCYFLEQDTSGQYFLGVCAHEGGVAEMYPLEYDDRHKRLFLHARHEKALGARAVTELERLTRRVISR